MTKIGQLLGKSIIIPLKYQNVLQLYQRGKTTHQYDSDELIIELDPGMAFGTGTHPTTVMCLQALEKSVKQDDLSLTLEQAQAFCQLAQLCLVQKACMRLT